jgi:hypothetical protein
MADKVPLYQGMKSPMHACAVKVNVCTHTVKPQFPTKRRLNEGTAKDCKRTTGIRLIVLFQPVAVLLTVPEECRGLRA